MAKKEAKTLTKAQTMTIEAADGATLPIAEGSLIVLIEQVGGSESYYYAIDYMPLAEGIRPKLWGLVRDYPRSQSYARGLWKVVRVRRGRNPGWLKLTLARPDRQEAAYFIWLHTPTSYQTEETYARLEQEAFGVEE